MTMPLVSVVMPVYNGESYLAQAVESVLAQSYPSIELIAVDDGSSDGSAAILAGYSDRVEVIRQANAGVAAARNAGISRARGEFVAFLDQDDWWLPEKIELQLRLFKSDVRIGLVHTAVSHCVESSLGGIMPTESHAGQESLVGDCYSLLLQRNSIVNSSVVVRTSMLEEVGECDTSMGRNTCQDYDLWLRIAKRFPFGYVSKPVTVLRLHSSQGHRDYRAILSDQLSVLLRHRQPDLWKSTAEGRNRLAQLHDRLGAAHFDAGEPKQARRHFACAFRIESSPRRLLRLGASCLPYSIAHGLRTAWQVSRQTGRLLRLQSV